MAWLDDVRKVMDAWGIPEYIWKPIMTLESGGNPKAYNPRETATGLFQIRHDVHTQYAGLDLLDPVVNAQVAARDFLVPAWRRAREIFSDPGQQAAFVWREGLRPKWTPVKEKTVMALARQEVGTMPEENKNASWFVEGGRIEPWSPSLWQRFKRGFQDRLAEAGVGIAGRSLETIDPKTGEITTIKPEDVTAGAKDGSIFDGLRYGLRLGLVYVLLVLAVFFSIFMAFRDGGRS